MWDQRVTLLNNRYAQSGDVVVYWMQRSQRSRSNLALNLAIERAGDLGQPVLCYFALDDSYPLATARNFAFLLDGLRDVRAGLQERNVGFVIRHIRTPEGIASFAREVRASLVVTDQSHLHFGRRRRKEAAHLLARMDVSLLEVDNDVLVPVRVLAKEHVGAFAIRGKIQRYRDENLQHIQDFVATHVPPTIHSDVDLDDIDRALSRLTLDRTVRRVPGMPGGEAAGRLRLHQFVAASLERYHVDRNNPVLDATSGLSPYLHFGHLDPWTVALAVSAAEAPEEARVGYLEELLVRRELASNFTFYNPAYSHFEGIQEWARQTLVAHQDDARPAIYSRAELEGSATGDELWNAAQRQLVTSGSMHGYMRMYWGKQIITWTRTPQEALSHMLYLNNLYALDGRDPVSYTNIAWCLGKHDRPWPERPIFGKVRSMTRSGAERKFDVQDYIRKVNSRAVAAL